MTAAVRRLRGSDVPPLQEFLLGRDRERVAECQPALEAGDAFAFVTTAAREVDGSGSSRANGWVIVHLRLRNDQGWEPGGGTLEFQGNGNAYLENLEVEASARGLGLGSALLDAAEAEAAVRAVHSLWLHVREGNAGARRLYERVGYTLVDRVEPAWIDEPMCVYRKQLGEDQAPR